MKIRWKEGLLAFMMAFVLWYGVSGSEKLETQVEVRVDYRSLPPGLVVKQGLINRLSVRVSAPMAMLRSLTGREFTMFMDLSTVHKGEQVLPVSVDSRTFPGGVEVIEVSPSRISLEVDTLEEKKVPLVAVITGDLPEDYIAQVAFSPKEVLVSGPSSMLENINDVEVPVNVQEPVQPGVTEVQRVLHLPEGVDAAPLEAKVSLHIGIKRKLVKVSRSVHVDAPASFGTFLRPEKVSISIAMPESIAGKATSNREIRAFVTPPREDLGSYTLPVQVSLPEGAEVVTVEPAEVTLTLEQKQAPPAGKK